MTDIGPSNSVEQWRTRFAGLAHLANAGAFSEPQFLPVGSAASTAAANWAGTFDRTVAGYAGTWFGQSPAGIGHNAAINPVWERRLEKLETFMGDQEMGYARPNGRAVSYVRRVLSSIYRNRPTLPAPAISPAADGEILISWRVPGAYFVLSFEDGETFDWLGSAPRRFSGTLETKNAEDRYAPLLASAIGATLGHQNSPCSIAGTPTVHRS